MEEEIVPRRTLFLYTNMYISICIYTFYMLYIYIRVMFGYVATVTIFILKLLTFWMRIRIYSIGVYIVNVYAMHVDKLQTRITIFFSTYLL